MTKGPASTGRVGELHHKITEVMIRAIEQIDQAQQAYDPENDEQNAGPPEVSAPLMAVITKFLKDNSVTCAPEEGNSMSELEKTLENKRHRRRARVGNVVPFLADDE